MPTTVALVPLTHPDTGKQVAAGEDITLGDEDYFDMRMDGKVAASSSEVRDHSTDDAQGNYRSRTTRADTGEAVSEEQPKRVEEKKK